MSVRIERRLPLRNIKGTSRDSNLSLEMGSTYSMQSLLYVFSLPKQSLHQRVMERGRSRYDYRDGLEQSGGDRLSRASLGSTWNRSSSITCSCGAMLPVGFRRLHGSTFARCASINGWRSNPITIHGSIARHVNRIWIVAKF